MNQATAMTLPMMSQIWARVRKEGAHILRRGAWYNVLREPKNGIVLLEINKQIVPMNEQFVTLSRQRPAKWSVVARETADYGARRASMTGRLEPTYAVCPHCRTRTNVDHSMTETACPKCGNTYEVDWGELV